MFDANELDLRHIEGYKEPILGKFDKEMENYRKEVEAFVTRSIVRNAEMAKYLGLEEIG